MEINKEYPFERSIVAEIRRGIGRSKRLIHIMTGLRQVGKTTAALQIAAKWQGPVINASADLGLPPGAEWIQAHWDRAVQAAKRAQKETLLILDGLVKT